MVRLLIKYFVLCSIMARIEVSKDTKEMLEELREPDESLEDVILILADREEDDEEDNEEDDEEEEE